MLSSTDNQFARIAAKDGLGKYLQNTCLRCGWRGFRYYDGNECRASLLDQERRQHKGACGPGNTVRRV